MIRYRVYASIYRVGSDGSVWSIRKGEGWVRKSTRVDKWGYQLVGLRVGGKKYKKLVHRLVLEVFVGPCPVGMQCRHLNGIPSDNRLENLQWGTPKENTQDKIKHGSPFIKLGEDEVRAIRAEYARGGVSKAAIGRRYGMSGQVIGRIIRGKSWKHL